MKRFSKLAGSAILAMTILFGAGASTAGASVTTNCDFFTVSNGAASFIVQMAFSTSDSPGIRG